MPALLRVAGQTLIEYQVRVAHHCGAGHIVVLVDQMPSALVEAFDRLRADGIDIEIARDARDAADRIHPDEALLVMANGAVASRDIVWAIASAETSVLLTVADTEINQSYERINAHARWAGIALIDGSLLRATSAILGDWTLGPTLLRTAVQAGAERRQRAADGLSAILHDEVAALAFSNRLAEGTSKQASGWFAQMVTNRLARRATPFLMSRKIPLDLIITLPMVALGSALLLSMTGWHAVGFGVFLASLIFGTISVIMMSISARTSRLLAWFETLRLPTLCVMLILSGISAGAAIGDYSALILALWGGSLMLLVPKDRTDQLWYAQGDSAALVMLVCSLAAAPTIGLTIIVLHGMVTRIYELGWFDKGGPKI